MNQYLRTFSKRILLTMGLVMLIQVVFGQNLVVWEMSGASGSQASSVPSALPIGITSASLIRGSGVTAIGFSGSINSSAWFSSNATTTLAEAITNNDYYQFTITIAEGYKAKLTGVGLVLRASNTGPNRVTLRSSVDNYGADLGSATVTTNPLLETITFATTLTVTGTITFRLYGYGSAANASNTPNMSGTLRIGGSTTAADDDLLVYGTVAPTISMSVNATSGSEIGTTAITVTATASSNVAGDQTVEVGVSGTGITSGDYTLSAAKITIPSGGSTGSITFKVVDDFIAENTETATLSFTNLSSGISLGETSSQVITITDNDVAGIILTESGGTTKVKEGAETDTYSIVLKSEPVSNVTISITPGGQVTTNPTTIIFTPANWNSAQTVTITAVDDALIEGNHTATISHSVSSDDVNYNGSAVLPITVTIADNDEAFLCPTLSFTGSGSVELCSGDNTTDITLTSTRNDLDVKLVYFTSPQTGTSMYAGGTLLGSSGTPSGTNSLYTLTFNDLTFPPNTTGTAITYYVYAILDVADVQLTENSCRPYASFEVTVKPQVTPSVLIASDDSDNSIVAGTTVNFTAAITNGGAAPSLQWKKNNTNVGTSSTTYTDAQLTDGDVITCVLISNATCPVISTVTSNEISVKVRPAEVVCVPPIASELTGGGSFCIGGDGALIGLASSETGVKYQLKKGENNVNEPLDGTGGAISFGKIAVAGTYTVVATRTVGGCSTTFSSSVIISERQSVGGKLTQTEGKASVCFGTSLSNTYILSEHTGNVTKWQFSSSPTFETTTDIVNTMTTLTVNVSGLTNTTYYRAVVKNGDCAEAYSSTVSVTIEALPIRFDVSGSGLFCAGSEAIVVLSSSETGVLYSLVKDSNEVANSDISGTGQGIKFMAVTTNGTYSIRATRGNCSVNMNGNAVISFNDPINASISGGRETCLHSSAPLVSFSATGGTKPYTFVYTINGGANQTTTASTVSVPTNTSGVLMYELVGVIDANGCIGTLNTKTTKFLVIGAPHITLTVQQTTVGEGSTRVFCDTDSNPANDLQFIVSGLCVSGSPVWRSQIGNGTWSEWATRPPTAQPSNNQPHRYQAACDANCTATFTTPIEITINYRASVPKNVMLMVEGTKVIEGETKEMCISSTASLAFSATCAESETLLYSVDGGEYTSVIPQAMLDNQFHNYRLRCRQIDKIISCAETESGVIRVKLVKIPLAPTVSLSSTTNCNSPSNFSGQSSCGALKTIWYNAFTDTALPALPSTPPTATSSFYARCQTENWCVSEKSNVVTFTVTPVESAPIVTVSQSSVCMGTAVTVAANCPVGSTTFWNTGVTNPSFEVSFKNRTKQTYWAKCIFEGGCQSAESERKEVSWNAFAITLINVGQSQSAIKSNDRNAWSSQFVTIDGGPSLDQSSPQNPTLYYVENRNKIAPRYWTINVDACELGTSGSLTFDMLVTPEVGVVRSYNTHENNAPYFMYANREGWTELYGPNHPAYGFYEDNGNGGNVYDAGLPKGLYKLGIRYWDMKGWGSIYPSTRKPQGNILAYQEYWFRIQSRDGVGGGAAREGTNDEGQTAARQKATVFAEVMPNPITDVLRLRLQDCKGQTVQATLIDGAGREILNHSFVVETNTHEEEFSTTNLAAGIYFLKTSTDKQRYVLKVIKK